LLETAFLRDGTLEWLKKTQFVITTLESPDAGKATHQGPPHNTRPDGTMKHPPGMPSDTDYPESVRVWLHPSAADATNAIVLGKAIQVNKLTVASIGSVARTPLTSIGGFGDSRFWRGLLPQHDWLLKTIQ
jgi:hypothetical protein